MRAAATLGLLVPALFCGCNKPGTDAPKPDHPPAVAAREQPVPPVQPFGGPPREEAVTINADTDGRQRVGPAVVSLEAALWDKYDDTVPTISVLVRIECPAEGGSFILKGWAFDKELVESITGKQVAPSGNTPLPVNFSATTDRGEKLRGIMRSITGRPKGKEVEIGTSEARVVPGKPFGWVLTFERPGPNAKELTVDVDAADFGGTGRVRFKLPSQAEWKPAKR